MGQGAEGVRGGSLSRGCAREARADPWQPSLAAPQRRAARPGGPPEIVRQECGDGDAGRRRGLM